MSVDLSLEHVSAAYGDTVVLNDLSLGVRAGELVSLLGASGCGKTTTLRLVAGFLQPVGGTILLGERDLTRMPAHKRDIGLVFQSYALFPHLCVRDNVGFGLKQRGLDAAARRTRVDAMLERVELSALADRYPGALSGGQRQRVALARALVIEPSLLMFDEPLSNLDARLRVDMRVEIRRLQQAQGATALYVTHDQEEAFSISDRVAIMDGGRLQQFDAPETLYRRPANAFVARFVGFENIVPLRMEDAGTPDDAPVALGPDGTSVALPPHWDAPPSSFRLAARADGLVVADPEAQGIPARVDLRTYLGRAYQYRCHSPFGTLIANGPPENPVEPGAPVRLTLNPAECAILAEGGA